MAQGFAWSRWVAGGIATAVLLAACTGGSHETGSAAASGASTSARSSSALSETRATELERGLVSSDPAPVLAPALRAGVTSASKALLPPGSTLQIDTSSMKVTGETATVHGRVARAGAVSQTWDLLLVRAGNTWQVYGTRQAS